MCRYNINDNVNLKNYREVKKFNVNKSRCVNLRFSSCW